ncbi:hypothetical protein D9M71_231270 [compost metagenome]
MKHRIVSQFKPDPPTIALDRRNSTADQGEPRLAQPFGGNYRGFAPDTQAPFTRYALGLLLAGHQVDIRRYCHQITQPFAEQLRFKTVAACTKHVRQGAAVMIALLGADQQIDTPVTCVDQRLQALARRIGIRFGWAPLATNFRGIDADQAHATAILQAQGVTIDHLAHLHHWQAAGCRAKRLGRRQPNRGHKKGAHKGRLFHQHGKAAAASQGDQP